MNPTCPDCQRTMRPRGLRAWYCTFCQRRWSEEELPDAAQDPEGTGDDGTTAAYYDGAIAISEETALRRLSRSLPALFEAAP
jgi:hypothetical protein